MTWHTTSWLPPSKVSSWDLFAFGMMPTLQYGINHLVSNGDFDAYWHYPLDQEHHRVHHTRYRDSYQHAA